MLVTYSIIIPVYNSNRSLSELVERLHFVFSENIRDSYEIILVDDCSPRQETWDMLRALVRNDFKVRVFRLARNFGQNCAILCGMAHSKGRWIVTMDDDLQHRPEDIPLLIEKRDHDVVIARFAKKQCGCWKKWASKFKSRLDIHLLGKPSHIAYSAFRLIKRRVAQDILSISTPRPFIIASILYVTSDLVNVDVTHKTRKYGKSNYTLRKSFSLLSNMLFNNSSFMLRAMSMFGLWLALLSFVFGIALSIRRLMQSQPIQGWTSLMVMVLISTGVIIFCLGVLGEYVARLIETTESRPTWVIRDQIDYMGNE